MWYSTLAFCICDYITNWSIASYQEIFLSIPVEDKLATYEIDYISLHNTHICRPLTQLNKTKEHTSNIRAAYYFHLARKYLLWSNTNYHRLWWVQRIPAKSFSFFVNIKIIAKKTTAPSFVTSWITLSWKFRCRNQTNILILFWSNFFHK